MKGGGVGCIDRLCNFELLTTNSCVCEINRFQVKKKIHI